MVANLSLGVENHRVACESDLWFGLLVVFIGVILAFGAHALANYHGDLLVISDADVHRAVIVIDAKAGNRGRYGLFEMVVEIVGLAKNVVEVAAIDAHVVADLTPVKSRGLGGNESADDNDDDQKNPAGSDAARRQSIALGLLVLDQLEHSPQNQQQWPVVGEPGSQARPGEQVHVAQKENDSKD